MRSKIQEAKQVGHFPLQEHHRRVTSTRFAFSSAVCCSLFVIREILKKNSGKEEAENSVRQKAEMPKRRITENSKNRKQKILKSSLSLSFVFTNASLSVTNAFIPFHVKLVPYRRRLDSFEIKINTFQIKMMIRDLSLKKKLQFTCPSKLSAVVEISEIQIFAVELMNEVTQFSVQ